MNSPDDKGVDKLEQALTQAYRSKPDTPAASIDVTRRVMHDIRHAADEERWRLPSVMLDDFVWRTATIAAAVMLIVTVLTVELFRSPGGENALLLAEDFATTAFLGD